MKRGLLVGLLIGLMFSVNCFAGGLPAVKYAVPITIAAAPAYIANDQGFWKDYGLDVELIIFSSGRQALDAVIAESAQIFSAAETPPIHAAVQGHKVYWVATVADHRETKLTIRTDRGITLPMGLEGKTIATLPGTNSDYYMYRYLDKYGIDISKVKVVVMKPPMMVTAFVSGDIDGYFSWEPHNYYGQSRMKDVSVTVPTDPSLYHGYQGIIMNESFVKENPGVVDAVILGFLKAEKFIKEHPDKAKEIVSKKMGIDMEALSDLWPEFDFVVHLNPGLLELLQGEGAWATEVRGSKSVTDWRGRIYTDGMSRVAPDRMTLK